MESPRRRIARRGNGARRVGPLFAMRCSPSERAAVERLALERREIDIVEAAHVDRDHRLALGADPAREGLPAAGAAEEMMDAVLVELVFGKAVFALEQLELAWRREGEQQSQCLAVRTIALDHGADIGGDLVADALAMAAAQMGFHFRHVGPPWPVRPARSMTMLPPSRNHHGLVERWRRGRVSARRASRAALTNTRRTAMGNPFVHGEFNTTDPRNAKEFYGELFQ